MIAEILYKFTETAPNYVLAAGAICGLTAATLVLLMRHSDKTTKFQRAYGAFWIAVIAGVGVWTTHFVAMIGFRPDASLYYDLRMTLFSILVGILFIGLPLAASEFFRGWKNSRLLGCVAGLGVTAMHLTGMSALENCLPTFSPTMMGVAVTISMVFFAWALKQSRRTVSGLIKKAIGISGGVCGLHFTAMASVTLTEIEHQAEGLGANSLSILVVVIALSVFAITFIGTLNHRRRLVHQLMTHDESFPPAQRIVRTLRS